MTGSDEQDVKNSTEISHVCNDSAVVRSQEAVCTDGDIETGPEINRASITVPIADGELNEFDAAEKKKQEAVVNKQVWSLVMMNPRWLLLSMTGGAGFGSIFPIWGLLLSKT